VAVSTSCNFFILLILLLQVIQVILLPQVHLVPQLPQVLLLILMFLMLLVQQCNTGALLLPLQVHLLLQLLLLLPLIHSVRSNAAMHFKIVIANIFNHLNGFKKGQSYKLRMRTALGHKAVVKALAVACTVTTFIKSE